LQFNSTATATVDGDNEEIITEDVHGSELPTRVFVRKFKDDDGENVVIIDGNMNPNEANADIVLNSNDNESGVHNRTMNSSSNKLMRTETLLS